MIGGVDPGLHGVIGFGERDVALGAPARTQPVPLAAARVGTGTGLGIGPAPAAPSAVLLVGDVRAPVGNTLGDRQVGHEIVRWGPVPVLLAVGA